ncbi:hypothetical protein BDP27DRAFT_241404 [Rhodocollybia butyracea]|uniref:Uncharacterized protein n=1 Tax=Rhodocollybia butyracea TaxID=206335 RepID=A0A9P5PJR0_9AGAR|nr:hypothetical protein BDP27DRAFT_241404 [Rhodocollybia butyracea]
MFVPSHLLLALVLFRALESTLADRNITIDDNDGAIKYSPGWSVSSGFNALDYQGSHHLTDNKSATANFTFTGVAVYIMAPLWPFAVGAQAGVDGSSPVAIDMQDHTHTDPTEQAPEDVNTTVLWGMEGLTNSSHTLQISFWSIEDWMTLDAIM